MLTLGVTDFDDTVKLQVVTREPDFYDSNGNAVKGVELTPVNIDADVQPVSGKILQDLPEGVRDQVSFTIWTSYELQNDHIVIYDSKRYRVLHVWPRRLDGFTKAAIGGLDE